MMQVTMQVPDELGRRIETRSAQLPAIIQLSLIGFRTLATAAAGEVSEYCLIPQSVSLYKLEGASIYPLGPEARVTVKIRRLNDED